jgi:hypothetical protein
VVTLQTTAFRLCVSNKPDQKRIISYVRVDKGDYLCRHLPSGSTIFLGDRKHGKENLLESICSFADRFSFVDCFYILRMNVSISQEHSEAITTEKVKGADGTFRFFLTQAEKKKTWLSCIGRG